MKESRLFSFIDQQSAFTIHYIDGRKLLEDINNIHNIGPLASKFYRNVILSAMQMVNFMKATENMGFYIDSEAPYFRFKVEMNSQGTMRTLLLPEEFKAFPSDITGNARITKAYPNKAPYSSIVKLEKEPEDQVINKILKESYQSNSVISVGKKDISFMFSKLPPTNLSQKFDEVVDIPLADFIESTKELIKEIDKESLEKEADIIDSFKKKGFTYLGSKELKFSCPCSRERMVTNLMTLTEDDRREIFRDSKSTETRCDYCNSIYEINESELKEQ